MEKIIQKLVEFDQKGQQIVQQAQQQRQELLAHIADCIQTLSDDYLARSAHRVECFQLQTQQEKQEQIALLQQQFEAQSAVLQRVYQENSEQWTEQMVKRCIGG